ncbi:unnamed protein product [Camellia sinensis]
MDRKLISIRDHSLCFFLISQKLIFDHLLVLLVYSSILFRLPNIKDMSGLAADDAISSVVIESEYSCRRFSLAEIQSTTINFNENLVIGVGGFGKVYKGFIDKGATAVAIKRLNAESKQGAEEFWTEINMLSKLHHTHLVALIGQCSDCQEMILAYEYMARGTLADHLYKRSRRNQTEISTFHLTWERRLDICIGAARGLDYLHTGTDQSFIHRDVKSTNILLDENWVAKISDFGLSKGTTSNSVTHVSTRVKGTFGYLDPDYFYTYRLTKKSDVYAFGVVLLEVLSGRPPVDERLEEEQISLILWAQDCIKKGRLDLIIDPSLSEQITPQSLKYFVEVAYNCLHNRPKERPTMAEVVGSLDLALVSQRKGRSEGIIGKALKGFVIMPKGMNRWWRERKENSSKSGLSKDLFLEPLSDGANQPHRHFSLADIQAAANDFNKLLWIETNGLYKVYKGFLDGETSIVMIKRFNALASQNWEEDWADIEVHCLLENHPHIVSLIGFCNVKPELIGVYDYMENGSLEDHLFNTNNNTLLWKERLKICIGAALGLQHLHENAKQRVIHGDIKPANILLDENWVAKLTHFRFSKLIPNNTTFVTLTDSNVCGTMGYRAPELWMHGKLTTKSDVYSFGMVLLSVLCAKKPYYELDGDCKSLVDQFMNTPECLKEFVNIAISCLLDQDNWRPSIDNVVRNLQSALLLQEAWENHFEIGAELPVIDLYCCSIFSTDGCWTIGDLRLFPSNVDDDLADDLASNLDGGSNGYLSDTDFDELIR